MSESQDSSFDIRCLDINREMMLFCSVLRLTSCTRQFLVKALLSSRDEASSRKLQGKAADQCRGVVGPVLACDQLRSTPAQSVGAIPQRVPDGHQELHPLRALTRRSCVGRHQTTTCITLHDCPFGNISRRKFVGVVPWVWFLLIVHWNGGNSYNLGN